MNPTTPFAPTIPSSWDPTSQRALGQKNSLRSSRWVVLTLEPLTEVNQALELSVRKITDPDDSPGSPIPPWG